MSTRYRIVRTRPRDHDWFQAEKRTWFGWWPLGTKELSQAEAQLHIDIDKGLVVPRHEPKVVHEETVP